MRPPSTAPLCAALCLAFAYLPFTTFFAIFAIFLTIFFVEAIVLLLSASAAREPWLVVAWVGRGIRRQRMPR